VAFSPDGKTVLTGSWDKTARLWNAGTGKPIGAALQHRAYVLAVAFSPDGKTVLTGSQDNTARLWEAGTGKPIGAALQHQNLVQAVAFSPDGKMALTGSRDNTARLWEAGTGKPIGTALHHQGAAALQDQGPVVTVAFSPDGKTVLGSWDKTARLWRLPRVLGDPERVALWARLVTGIDLDEHGEPVPLGAAEWHQRRQRLEKLGGPPLK
jgi:WD40 repeat protein